MADFQKALEYVLKNEGGYVDRPLDRGGPTNFGITLTSLSTYMRAKASVEQLQFLTKEYVEAVYFSLYWNPYHFDMIQDDTLATIMFDQAVNRGPVTVIRQIQKCLGLPVDGVMGPMTINNIHASNTKELALRFYFESQNSYVRICQKNPSQLEFLAGWLKRTHEYLRMI